MAARQIKQVFFDEKGKRAIIVDYILCTLLAAAIVAVTNLGMILLWKSSKTSGEFGENQLIARPPAILKPRSEPAFSHTRHRTPSEEQLRQTRRYAFLSSWDENSVLSLKRHAANLDFVIADWLSLSADGKNVSGAFATIEKQTRTWAKINAPDLKFLPVLENTNQATSNPDRLRTAQLLQDKSQQESLIASVLSSLQTSDYPGLVLSFDDIGSDLRQKFVDFAHDLQAALAAENRQLIVSVPAGSAWSDFRGLADFADRILINIANERSTGDEPGPVASQGWFESELDRWIAAIGPEKCIITIGSFAIDWNGPGSGSQISVIEAWRRMEHAKSTSLFEPSSLNGNFRYAERGASHAHEVWLLDGVSFRNQYSTALAANVSGVALNRLGTEDGTVWASMPTRANAAWPALDELSKLVPASEVAFRGEGEKIHLVGDYKEGKRTIREENNNNLIIAAKIVSPPTVPTVTRSGAGSEKLIALSFDDGPDPTYTPKILDILKEKNVKASFFVIGMSTLRNMDLLKRVYQEGHDIGNHTFSHPNLLNIGEDQLDLEIKATERLIQAVIGIKTTLMRPPYNEGLVPQSAAELTVLRRANVMGYASIGADLDTLDWAGRSANMIVEAAVNKARLHYGNVILMHDGGGNRTPTIEALPRVIDQLQSEGYRFVTVHELYNLHRGQAMQVIASDRGTKVSRGIIETGVKFASSFNVTLAVVFVGAIGAGTLRMLVMLIGAMVHNQRDKARRRGEMILPQSIAVIVPAYNEAKVVCGTIQSLLSCTIDGFPILVIDDGSTDDTVNVVKSRFADNPRVQLLQKTNGGKASALNYGLSKTSAEVVVMLDADTLLEPTAIGELVRHFADPKIAAVAGTVDVGNRLNLLTRFQSLEYVISQNLDRRALELVNAIQVVPGSIGAWRRSALNSIGRLAEDTLAEDADATMRLSRNGWKVIYEPRARALTEAPETLAAFNKQRFRWMFGTLQAAYKHRDSFLGWPATTVGWVILPNVFVFQFFFALISPIIDLFLILALVRAAWFWRETTIWAFDGLTLFWLYFAILEMMGAAIALYLTPFRGYIRLLPLVILQRFCYRQLLYWSAVRTLSAAIKGQVVGWNKLQRTGHVASQPAE